METLIISYLLRNCIITYLKNVQKTNFNFIFQSIVLVFERYLIFLRNYDDFSFNTLIRCQY